MERYNVASKLVDTLVESGEGDRVAVYYRDRTYTRRQLFDMVNRAGNALLDLGVRVEERVLISLHDSPEALASFLGAIKIGAIPVMVNYMYTANDYLHLLNDSRATTLIVDEDFLDTAQSRREEFLYLKNTVVVGKRQGDGLLSFKQLKDDLKAFVKNKIAAYKYPRWVDFVPELPKTATGKVQRHKLRD